MTKDCCNVTVLWLEIPSSNLPLHLQESKGPTLSILYQIMISPVLQGLSANNLGHLF